MLGRCTFVAASALAGMSFEKCRATLLATEADTAPGLIIREQADPEQKVRGPIGHTRVTPESEPRLNKTTGGRLKQISLIGYDFDDRKLVE